MGAAPTPDASAMAAAAAAAAAAADPHDMHRLALMASMTSALSLLGSSALILTFAFFRSYRSQAARVTCYLAVADLITAVAKLIGQAGFSGGDESALCQAQGAVIFWGDLSSCLWVTILAINLLLILCFSRTVADLRRYEVYYVMIGYGAPLLFAVPPLFVRGPPMYANSGLWCWISFEYKYWRIILLFAPLWALFAFNAAVYILSARIIWKRSAVSRTLAYGSSALASFRRTYARNVSFYIAAYVISWGPATLNRVYHVLVGRTPFELRMLHALTSPLRGLLHFVAFFYVTFYLGHREKQPPPAPAGAAGAAACAEMCRRPSKRSGGRPTPTLTPSPSPSCTCGQETPLSLAAAALEEEEEEEAAGV